MKRPRQFLEDGSVWGAAGYDGDTDRLSPISVPIAAGMCRRGRGSGYGEGPGMGRESGLWKELQWVEGKERGDGFS